jgi:tight adherence protein C
VLLLIVGVGLLTVFAVICFVLARDEAQRNRILIKNQHMHNKERAWSAISEICAPTTKALFPKDVWEKTANKLRWAGLDYTVLDFLSLKLLGGIVLPLMLSIAGLAAGIDFLIFPLLAVTGFILPDILLGRKVKKRQGAIQKDLYEFELMLSTVISAGLEVVEAFRMVGERFGGEINKEVLITWGDINTGTSKSQALEKMSNRIGLNDFTQLIYNINQSDQLGTPLVETMDNLVEQMESNKANNLQRLSEEAKVKILIPTVIWILIPLLVMMFYPIVTQLNNAF